jgi:hypothetical protein
MREGEVLPATTAPVKEIFVDEAKYARTVKIKTQNTINKTQRVDDKMQESDNRKQTASVVKAWTKGDEKSLLDDQIEETAKMKAANVLPDKRDDLYNLFVKEIRFPVKDELRGRLQSLIVSFVKGIRNEEQVDGYLERSEAEGGLGLTGMQVEAVMAAIKKVWRLANTPPAPLREGSTKIPSSEEGEGGVRTHPKLPPRRRVEEVSWINAKTIMQDVTPPKVEKVEIKKMSVGPVDEIATMSLTNFRQLASTAGQAAQILQEKFFTLKKESIVLYLQAVEVWRSSPLYKDYQDLIKRAVSERRKLSEVVNGNNGMKWEEFLQIAEVGKMV